MTKLIYFGISVVLSLGCSKGGGGNSGSAVVSPTPTPAAAAPKYTDAVTDPLGAYEWHIKNIGQSTYSSLPSSAVQGTDINLGSTHDTYRGAGLTVVVADGRIDLDHPDLIANTNLAMSKNYAVSMSSGVNPTTSNDADFHGTGVMGLIGAARGKGFGMFGVAPLAKLIGLNYLDSDQSQSKQQDMVNSVFAGIYNFSFGFNTCAVVPFNSGYFDYLQWLSTTYSFVYMTSGGNDYSGNRTLCGGTSGTYLGNGNLDQIKSHPYFIVTAAINNQGVSTSYSTPSSNTWISAPGGELYSSGGLPLLTTDLVGCAKGNALSTSSIAFDKNQFGNNSNCNYTTNGAAGTSFASPIVTGAVALILESLDYGNQNMRTVKYILANTAKKVDPTSGNSGHPGGLNLAGYVYQNGWITNAAGYKFHNWYGFGLVDVTAAISFAKTLKGFILAPAKFTYLPGGGYFYKSGAAINVAIPDNSASGAVSQINVDSHDLIVEHVLINVNITHTHVGDLGIELTSPSGTTSKLMNINSNIVGANLTNVTLGSNAFFGEKTKGFWTIRVVDGASVDTGTLVNWSITFLGHNPGTGTAPLPVSNVSNTGNTITWTPSPSAILRYEACIQGASSTITPAPFEWFPISGSSSSYSVTKYSIIGWFNISSGGSYKIRIRAIDTNENESSTVAYTWVAP